MTLPWTPATSLALLAFELPLAFELELLLDGLRELRVFVVGQVRLHHPADQPH